MKLSWKGVWKDGELVIEAESLDELSSTISKIQGDVTKEGSSFSESDDNVPKLSGNIGCTEAVRLALSSNWGKKMPRSMMELQNVFEKNALFFSRGTLSGVLTYMTRTGQIRRLERQGKWAYVPTNV